MSKSNPKEQDLPGDIYNVETTPAAGCYAIVNTRSGRRIYFPAGAYVPGINYHQRAHDACVRRNLINHHALLRQKLGVDDNDPLEVVFAMADQFMADWRDTDDDMNPIDRDPDLPIREAQLEAAKEHYARMRQLLGMGGA